MKKIVLISALSLICTLGAWAQKFNPTDYADRDGFTHIYISKNMMQMFESINVTSIDISQIVNKLDGIHIVHAQGGEPANTLKKDIEVFNTKHGYVLLMNVNEKGNKVKIKSSDPKKTQRKYVMSVEEKNNYVVVILDGTLTPKDAMNFLKTNKF